MGELTTRDRTSWARAYSSCRAGGPTVLYDALSVRNDTGASIRLQVTARWASDGYLHAYTNPFDRTMPTRGCLTGNDDFGGTSGSRITLTVAAGAIIDLVMSNYWGTATNPYTLTLITL